MCFVIQEWEIILLLLGPMKALFICISFGFLYWKEKVCFEKNL